ncbi:MAG: IS200/IS605 family transposase [Planctomycetaceae bacterium]|nr:IS200/IS605 family transposase [Planctomycetaceae bacterium]
MPQSFGSLHCHIVFSTKHREAWIKPDVQPRLFEYIGGILRNHSSPLVAAGGMQDHVHLLVSLARDSTVADAVRVVKSNSSRWLQETVRLKGFHWQDGYGAFAVSYSNLEQVKSYLANQEQHHRGQSYQDEFREFLRRHNLAWDEEYVWD